MLHIVPFLLVADFLSVAVLSLDRGAFLTTVRRAVRDELLELDEYDDPDSEPLESDEPIDFVKIIFFDFFLIKTKCGKLTGISGT